MNFPKIRNLARGLSLGTVACLLTVPSAQAGLVFTNDLLYYTNTLSSSSEDKVNRLYESLFVGASIPKVYFIGWNLGLQSRGNTTSAGTSSMSTLVTGPKFGVYIGKAQAFSLALAFNPLARATVTPAGGSEEKWSGYSIQVELGYTPQVGKHMYVGIKLIYDRASYSTSTNTANVQSNVSYGQSTILPLISLGWRFGQ
ncbi:MAG: hypothetical protein AB7P04_09345 [Bacteriovoracia bacterium]